MKTVLVVEKFETRNEKWYDYFVGINNERKIKQVFQVRYEGRRRRGGLRKNGKNKHERERWNIIKTLNKMVYGREQNRKLINVPTLKGKRRRRRRRKSFSAYYKRLLLFNCH